MSELPDDWTPAGGVMWCPEHHGIADECSSEPDRCDMAGADEECDLRELAYAPKGWPG